MEDPEHQRLAVLGERMLERFAAGDGDAVITMWESLTIREQRMVMSGLLGQVTRYRKELGHPPDATYGPR